MWGRRARMASAAAAVAIVLLFACAGSAFTDIGYMLEASSGRFRWRSQLREERRCAARVLRPARSQRPKGLQRIRHSRRRHPERSDHAHERDGPVRFGNDRSGQLV